MLSPARAEQQESMDDLVAEMEPGRDHEIRDSYRNPDPPYLFGASFQWQPPLNQTVFLEKNLGLSTYG